MKTRLAVRNAGRRADGGFSLIGVLVAIVIFGIGIMGLAVLLPIGSRAVSNSGTQTRASELCSTAAERLLTLPWGDADLVAGSHNDAGNPFPGGYWVSWVVENNQPVANCVRITIDVRWPTSASAPVQRLVIVNPMVD